MIYLKKHMKIHSGNSIADLRFCDTCGYSTARASNLARHMKIHSRGKPDRKAFPSLPYFHTLPSLYQDLKPAVAWD